MSSFTFGYVSFQIVALLVVLAILGRNKSWSAYTNTAASILTIVGVLGTFIGIYIGLQEFSTEDLQNSIKDLLDGLKLAFGTSIVGIASALLLKGIISPLVQTLQKKGDRDPIEEAIDKFVLALKDVETSGESNLSLKLDGLTKAIKNEDRDTGTVLGGINDIKTALTGEAERTIPTQLQNLSKVVSESRLNIIETSLSDEEGNLLTELRSVKKEISTKHDDLREEFQQFSKNVAESVAKLATDELIEALKKVIEEFNAKIQEQFGENFKHLNEAVGRTVEWQEQYRQQMDELANEFRIAAQSVEQSSAALASASQSLMTIEDQSESLVFIAGKLDPILHTLNDQLEAFGELRQKAREAFPEIEGRLDNLTREFSDAVQSAINDSHESMVKQRTELETQTNLLKKTIEDTAKGLGNIMERNREDIENHVNTLHSALRKEVNTLNESLGKELADSLQTLAGHFESLSNGFVKNYTELVVPYTQVLTALQQLVDASRQVPR